MEKPKFVNKSKILMVLTLLCLSIVILCFGVLSATSVNYTINGTINYNADGVYVKINVSVYTIAENQTKATVISTVKSMESIDVNQSSLSISDKIYTRTQKLSEYSSLNTNETYTQSDGFTLNYGTYGAYYIVINIKNLSVLRNVSAYITENVKADENVIKTTNVYQNDISSTQTKNIVLAYSIRDGSVSVGDQSVNYTINVGYDKYVDNSPKIQRNSTYSYYYITLGKKESTDTSENIKWKLVSLDDVTAYQYSSTDNFEMRYLSGAVFVQDTYVDKKYQFDACDDTSRSDYSNYYKSDIRQIVRDPATWNVTESRISSFIEKRNITEITSTGGGSITYTGTTEDYFWLLSGRESWFGYVGENKAMLLNGWWGDDLYGKTYTEDDLPRNNRHCWGREPFDDWGDVYNEVYNDSYGGMKVEDKYVIRGAFRVK